MMIMMIAWVGARKEEARIAMERAEDDGLDRAAGVAVEEAQHDVVGVVHRRCAGGGREEDLVGGGGLGGVSVCHPLLLHLLLRV